MIEKICQSIAKELNVNLKQVVAAVALLDEGATVPFISRYRKEVTGGLTDTDLRTLQERLTYLRELEERRATILDSIEKQGKLTDELKQLIMDADNKARLEDLYLPFKPRRRTKAQIAKEAGLEPLADILLSNPDQDPNIAAQTYLNAEKEITTVEQALEGARQILMERFAESADLIANLRKYLWENGLFTSTLVKDKEQAAQKFKDYFNYQEPIKRVPSHRALAVFRGQNENFLRVSLELPAEEQEVLCIEEVAKTFSIKNKKRPADQWLMQTVEWTWKIKLKLKLDVDLMMQLRESAEEEAINVFKDNLKNLLMAAPAGHRVTMGLDPGLRTGVKAIVVDDTGKLLCHHTIFPHVPRNDWDASMMILAKLCDHYKVSLISIGNGTASRETEQLVIAMMKKFPAMNITKVVVSEAGASVYSASELAAKEFPELDVSYRGAVSIARRLQDPLAELVKIDPKAIGVGQYQHDINQTKLGAGLEAVLEDCVNAVGADVNTASVPLLKSIAGLNETVAKKIVAYREQHGRFSDRQALKNVSGLGEKTYEQAIGFLRIIGGKNPLDASAVHPETYPVVDQILKKTGNGIKDIMGNTALINGLNAKEFATEQFGLPTVKDIFAELQKPGRDPRPEFKTATFDENILDVKDLKPGMTLEGVITNVANFGAFVDIGVHQDGLVHISHLADKFVSDPHEVVKVGMIVKVKVLEVDIARKRISLTMKSDDAGKTQTSTRKENSSTEKPKAKAISAPKNNAFAAALQGFKK
jgi:uncharacterized protein